MVICSMHSNADVEVECTVEVDMEKQETISSTLCTDVLSYHHSVNY